MDRKPTASSVSSALRRAGFLPMPPQHDGIHVRRGPLAGHVVVGCDFPLEAKSERMAGYVRQALLDAGYVARASGSFVYVEPAKGSSQVSAPARTSSPN